MKLNSLQRAYLLLPVLISTVGCDQLTKSAARQQLLGARPVELLQGVFVFDFTENTGAMLGLGADLPAGVRFWVLIVLAGLALLSSFWIVLRVPELNPVGVLGSALLVGGGLSNLLDRLLNDGAVVDFMHFGLGRLRTGIFNLADVAIMTGAGLLVFWSLGVRDKNRQSQP